LHFYSLITLAAISVAPTLAPVFLQFAAGSRWSETQAPTVLVAYCYYIPLLAINGITEAFVAATASETKLYLQSGMMGIWFVAFAASTYGFVSVLGMGAVGLIWSNCLNMALRVLFNGWFIIAEFRSRNSVRIFAFGGFADKPSILISLLVYQPLEASALLLEPGRCFMPRLEIHDPWIVYSPLSVCVQCLACH
jgi:oligosaccharide translocation protein RFT1